MIWQGYTEEQAKALENEKDERKRKLLIRLFRLFPDCKIVKDEEELYRF